MTHWAIDYIGKPWVSGADGPATYDCFGLVRAIYRARRGVEIPLVDADPMRVMSVMRAMHAYDYGAWARVDDPAELDVLQMSHGQHPSHVGVWVDVDGGRVLHAVRGAGVLCQSLGALKLNGWKVLDMYRRGDE